MSDDEVTLLAVVENLRENLRLEELRRKTAEERLREFEDKPTDRPPPSERSTARHEVLGEVLRELYQFRVTSAHLVTMIETQIRTSIGLQKMVTEDLPGIVEHAVAVAAANLKVEFGTELQKAKTKAYEASEAAKLIQEKCASCPHWREAS